MKDITYLKKYIGKKVSIQILNDSACFKEVILSNISNNSIGFIENKADDNYTEISSLPCLIEFIFEHFDLNYCSEKYDKVVITFNKIIFDNCYLIYSSNNIADFITEHGDHIILYADDFIIS